MTSPSYLLDPYPSQDMLKILAKLPLEIYAVQPSDPRQVIRIKRGVVGYFDVCRHVTAELAAEMVASLNANLVPAPSKAQVLAMTYGSCFGFDTPIADIDNYDANGNPILRSQS